MLSEATGTLRVGRFSSWARHETNLEHVVVVDQPFCRRNCVKLFRSEPLGGRRMTTRWPETQNSQGCPGATG
jgi:hypothetical protein